MKKTAIIILLLFSGFEYVNSQIVNPKPLSERITGYKIDCELDAKAKTVTGTMEAYWVNPSKDIVPDIQLHMYLNAFRSNKSTFFKDYGKINLHKKEDFGWINILSIYDKNGNDLKPVMKYISPDDGNPDDMTVLDISLLQPAKPGDTVVIKVSFVSKLPVIVARTGYNSDYFFVGQWFPKFGVYEPQGMRYAQKGGWNCHQFHSNSEFYANHSVYDVNITLPKEYVVGTGGMQLEEKEIDGGRKILKTRAEDIVDYAWTAWPGYSVFKDQWQHVKITLLIPTERKEQVNRQFTAVKHALEFFSKNVGPFPWPYLTIVDPPNKGTGSGGMEYTTLFTSESVNSIPDYLHLPEMATIHEFGHAYFMGILASNEFEEPWLDEGVNSFYEERIVDHYYGPDGGLIDHPFFKVTDMAFYRMPYTTSQNKQTVTNAENSWNYAHGTYGMMSYNKAATCLHTLMGIIGEESMNDAFREYYRRFAFKFPSGRDFINVVNEVVTKAHGDKFGTDLNWFFDQTIYGTGICDYKVNSIKSTRITGFQGMINDGDSVKYTGNLHTEDSLYISTVQINRIGEVMLPLDILVHFDNGDQVYETWTGKERFKDYNYTGKRKVDWVKIDPDYKIKMDVNLINNSMTLSPDRKPVRRYTDKLIAFMEFFINIISL